jgi:hypothetical protein
MNTSSSRARVLAASLVGAALGYLILHPYTVVVYGLYARGDNGLEAFDPHAIFMEALSAFRMGHLQMGIPFAILGAAAGLFLGAWLDIKRRTEEMELRTCATDTMKTLMVTLSHYLLNAATIIGGFAWRIQKSANDEETLHHAIIIRKEADSIEAVVKSLQSAQSVEAEKYTKDGDTMIIDLTEEINKRMKEQEAHDMDRDRI